MMRRSERWLAVMLVLSPALASAQAAGNAAALAPGQTCAFVTQAHADASAGTPNIKHDGSQLGSTPMPDIGAGFQGIPRSAQPPLTASQRRILECTYRFSEANADMPYTLFVPSSYDRSKPTPVVVDLHGLNITPLQQILFDGTTDLAERFGFILVAPMGYSTTAGWRSRPGTPVATAQVKPGTDIRYSPGELSELDAMTVLAMIRKHYNIDSDRIYLMGHSLGGSGTYYFGAKFNDIWAAIAPLAGAGGIPDQATAERYRAFPTLIMHGEKDSIVSVNTSRRAASRLQAAGAQFLYLEFPGKDHEFWIRRGAENMEKVFQFFATVSKRTTKGFITDEMIGPQGAGRGGAPATVPAEGGR